MRTNLVPFRCAVLVVCVVLGSPLAHSQDKCKVGQTIQQCWNLYLPEPDTPQKSAAVAEETSKAVSTGESVASSLETGLDGGAAALATTTRNLLPLLSFAGLISDSDGNTEDGLFSLDLNFLIGGLADDRNAQLKAVLNTKPEVSSLVGEAFGTGADAAARVTQLNDDLSAADDYTVSFTYSHINDRFGRGFKQHQRLFSRIFESAITQATEIGTLSDPVISMAKAIRLMPGTVNAATPIADTATLVLIESAAKSEAELEARVLATYTANDVSRFAQLVGNQPQLTFSAEIKQREDIVGPKETAIRFGYEWGFANVTELKKHLAGKCDLDASQLADLEQTTRCLSTYRDYVQANEARLENADRFSVELSYVDVDDFAYSSLADGIDVNAEGSRRIDGSFGYGRTMKATGGDRDSRFDVIAKYEDYSDDENYRDRFVATLTLTTQLNGMSIPISLVYANHGKYLPDVDEELGAHIGIKYSLDNSKP
jgi:hypothetical protein